MKMALFQVFVGIDVSRDWLDVHVLAPRRRVRVANDPAGWRQLAAALAEQPQASIALEASGGYERDVMRHLATAGWLVHCVDPYKVRQFARAAGRRAKNDRIDAETIARYLAAFSLEPAQIDPDLERLAEHVTYRRQLIEQRTAVANQARLLREPALRRLSRQRLARLDGLIQRLDRALAEQIESQPDLAAKAAVLQSVKGVGATLAATLIALLPELGTICRRKIAALVGVCPYDFDSGRFAGQRHIAGGRQHVRNALYMPTLVAMRFEPAIKAFYQRCVEGRREKKPAVIAAMRKLLTILNARMRDHLEAINAQNQSNQTA